MKKKKKSVAKKKVHVKKKVRPKKTKSMAKKEPSPVKNTKQIISRRIGTGTKNFDKLIGGGLQRNSTNLVVGGSGSGKSIFGVQFLIEGIKNKEKVLYISFEERKEAFYKNLLKVNIDLKKEEEKENFFFLEYTPQKVKTMLDEGGGAIETLVLTKKISRIVIDSISSFTLLFEKDLEKKEAALTLFSLLNGWQCTTVLISDEDSLDETESSKIIDQEVDSIIKFYFKRGSRVRNRYLEIMKMRGTNHSLNLHTFKITDGGLSVGSAIKKSAS